MALSSLQTIPASTTPVASPVSSPVIDKDIPHAQFLAEINESLDKKLSPLLSLVREIKDIRGELATVKSSIGVMDGRVNGIQEDLEMIKTRLEDDEQWNRMNNLEVKGIPQSNTENLLEIICSLGKLIHYPLTKNVINFVTRVPSRDSSNTKPIIVCFLNRYVKDDFIAAYRVASKTTPIIPISLGLQGNHKIYVNDHLTIQNKTLLNKTKKLAAEKGIQYVWVRNCKIYMRREVTSPVILVKSEKDFAKIAN